MRYNRPFRQKIDNTRPFSILHFKASHHYRACTLKEKLMIGWCYQLPAKTANNMSVSVFFFYKSMSFRIKSIIVAKSIASKVVLALCQYHVGFQCSSLLPKTNCLHLHMMTHGKKYLTELLQRFQDSRTSQTCRTWIATQSRSDRSDGLPVRMSWTVLLAFSLCFSFGPADFYSVRLYSTGAGPNVQHGFQSFFLPLLLLSSRARIELQSN